ncbi:MAG: 2-oxoglutarate dehydrogenase E1 subunit family protein, partial [Candidatus Binatia bacterium]
MDAAEKVPNSLSLGFVEGLYADYLRDPAAVPEDWRAYFESLGKENGFEKSARFGPSFRPSSVFNPAGGNGSAAAGQADVASLQEHVDQLIRNYRVRGHTAAKIDPLELPRPRPKELDLDYYGFTSADMQRRFSFDTFPDEGLLTLAEILERLRNTYCRSIGVQFMHIDDLAVREWLQERMERSQNRLQLTREQQLRILTRLSDAVVFEEFIQKKFRGAKSFSLEGAESLIPLLDLAIEKAGDQGIEEIVIGMPHRGRLNVLANIIGKSPRRIFREFEDRHRE